MDGEMTSRRRYLPWALGGGVAAIYALYAVLQFRHGWAVSFDLAIATQMVGHYANFETPVTEIAGPGFNGLGDHFNPILALLALPYRLFPSPVTLLVAQALLFGLSVVPIARLAIARVGELSGSFVALAYGLSWGLQQAVAFEFHDIAFAVPLLAFSLESFLNRRWVRSVLFAAPLVLVKEDQGLTVAMLGLLLIAYRQRLLGAVTAVYGVAASALTILVIIPHFNPDGRYSHLGRVVAEGSDESSVMSWILSLASQPLSLITPETKLNTLLMLFGITAGVALVSPLALLTLPTLVWRFASSNEGFWGTQAHYSAVLMPIVFVAMLDGLDRLRRSRWSLARRYATVVVPVITTIAVTQLGQQPLRELAGRDIWTEWPRAADRAAALAVIPPGASVESDLGLQRQLVARNVVYWIGSARGVAPDYMAVDEGSGWGPPAPEDLAGYAEAFHPGNDYELIWTQGGFSVVKRVNPVPVD